MPAAWRSVAAPLVSGLCLSSGVPADSMFAPPAVIPKKAGTPETARTSGDTLIARVAVDLSLPHLDRPFDYSVAPDQNALAVVGARVRVRFAGRLRDGFILARGQHTDHVGKLAGIHKIISAEPVLQPEIAQLIRAVADHYAGCFADVMRLAVPPRHAATEKMSPRARTPFDPDPARMTGSPLSHYPTGEALLAALHRGDSPRAAWQLVPSASVIGDWAAGFAAAAAATLLSGRGVLAVVPDHRDVRRLERACTELLGPDCFVTLTADLGPAARYRAFLAALRGEVRMVIGTRAAAFAPVVDLGLVALFDDGDDSLSEPRAPYPHAREVLALRAGSSGAAVLFAGYARTVEVQQWIDSGWLRELAADRVELRRAAASIKIAADTDFELERDPAARSTRLPHEVFEVIRRSLPLGPVLVQVPRSGYLAVLVCAGCRELVRCRHCHGAARAGPPGHRGARTSPPGQRALADPPVHRGALSGPPGEGPDGAGGPDVSGGLDRVVDCGWCGRLQTNWQCPHCGSARWRAPVVGSTRTAEELGKAFPGTPVRQSSAGRVLAEVSGDPALVVVTPGAEPVVAGGYAAVVLLDTTQLLIRPDLRAGEEALRRWLNALALVRPGTEQGSAIAVGPPAARALQALVRLDPAGHAARELAERAEARFPPAVKMITIEGGPAALADFTELLSRPVGAELLGPVELGPSYRSKLRQGSPMAAECRPDDVTPDESGPGEWAPGELLTSRLTLRCPLAATAQLTQAIKAVLGIRSARKSDGALRVRVDPVVIE